MRIQEAGCTRTIPPSHFIAGPENKRAADPFESTALHFELLSSDVREIRERGNRSDGDQFAA